MTVPIGPIDDTPPLKTVPITGQKGTLPIAAVDVPDDHNQVRVDLDGATMKLLSTSTLQVQCDIELSADGGKTWQFWAGCVFDGGWQGTYFRSRIIPDGVGRQTRVTLTVLKGTLDTTATIASANVATSAPQDFGHHSVGIDNTSDGGGSGGVSTLTWAHTLGASLTNSFLAVTGTTGSAGGTQFASVEWDSGGVNQPLALPDTSFRKADGTGNGKAEIWSVKAPSPSGAKNIKVTSVATCELCAGAISFYYVDQSGNGWRGGVGTGANGTVSGSTPQPSTGAIASNASDKVVAVAISDENSTNDTLVAGGGQTIFAHKEIGAGHSSHASSYADGASTVTMTFTGVGDTNLWAIVGGSVQWDGVNPASAVVSQPAFRQPVPMRPGPGGFDGIPFRLDTSRPAPSTPTATADSSATVPLSGSATGTVLVQGTSSSSLPLSGSATGTVLVQAASSTALPLAGAAAGTVLVQGVSSVSVPLSGAATGTVLVQATSTVSLSLSGSASAFATPCAIPPFQMAIPMRPGPGGLTIGRPFQLDTSSPAPLNPTATGASSLPLPLSGSATGTVLVQGASSVSVPLAGAAAGTVLVQATSTVSLPLSGAATATVQVQASSAAALPLSGSATGTVLVQAITVLPLPLTGSATASTGNVSTGISICTLPLIGTATGTVAATAPLGPSPLTVVARGRNTTVRPRGT